EATHNRPLMMLGKIQSGKTRSFIGLTALSFDNGYDLAIILTKNSNALAKQTVARMKSEFKVFDDDDMIEIFDIMCMHSNMSKYELDKKLIIVVKKEKNNIPKMLKFIQDYSLDKDKRCLIIDDEADFCSIGYEKNKETEDFDLRKIASQINELRLNLVCKFVQVTATPYSLYLQPTEVKLGDNSIEPVKPQQTVLVPYGDGYIGGEYYFDLEKHPLGQYLFNEIDKEELIILKSSDRRKFKEEEVLTSNRVKGIRSAIINFILGGSIRIIQNGGKIRGNKNKFSFIIHTEIGKAAHQRQENIINELMEALKVEATNDSEILNDLLVESYNELKESVSKYGHYVPSLEETLKMAKNSILEGYITYTVVNSEKDINTLLNDEGQLKLRTPFNIFIGGQILDRGVTIDRLIGFYYGRNPQKMQQDTVLQHSRMYGYREEKDLAVTRFYTTKDIYERMKKINEFDEKLREDFEKGGFNKGVIFISKDNLGKIIPCSPQKVKISNTQILKSGKTVLPVGFQTGYKTNIMKYINEIDKTLMKNNSGSLKGSYEISKEEGIRLIELVYETLEIESDTCIEKESFISLIKYLSKEKINVYCGIDRHINRLRKTAKYYADVPYQGDELVKARELAIKEPTLMMMRLTGTKEKHWNGAEFYWPVLVVPKNIGTVVYTSEILG
ncbi:MAG: Z1 domain-containing protein, partial [Clostridium sp.]